MDKPNVFLTNAISKTENAQLATRVHTHGAPRKLTTLGKEFDLSRGVSKIKGTNNVQVLPRAAVVPHRPTERRGRAAGMRGVQRLRLIALKVLSACLLVFARVVGGGGSFAWRHKSFPEHCSACNGVHGFHQFRSAQPAVHTFKFVRSVKLTTLPLQGRRAVEFVSRRPTNRVM